MRIDVSNKFSGDADAAGQGPHFENHWHRRILHLETPPLSPALCASVSLPVALSWGSLKYLFSPCF